MGVKKRQIYTPRKRPKAIRGVNRDYSDGDIKKWWEENKDRRWNPYTGWNSYVDDFITDLLK